jgi:hypothetical protein
MRKSFSFVVLILVLSASAAASELMDLGHGLGYLRVQSLDEAIKSLGGTQALVLDLRRTTTTPQSVSPFSTALATRPAAARTFVLIGPDTPAIVVRSLRGNVITLGPAGTRPEPQVVVAQTAGDDRRAFDALASGTPLADLITGKIAKERFDEASLVSEFKLGGVGAQPSESVPSSTSEAAARLTDRVLQRAVHLHRALLALKR